MQSAPVRRTRQWNRSSNLQEVNRAFDFLLEFCSARVINYERSFVQRGGREAGANSVWKLHRHIIHSDKESPLPNRSTANQTIVWPRARLHLHGVRYSLSPVLRALPSLPAHRRRACWGGCRPSLYYIPVVPGSRMHGRKRSASVSGIGAVHVIHGPRHGSQ